MISLMIVAQGLRSSALSCYGNDWINTPTIDRLASCGIVFDQYFADNPSPQSARNAWRSGFYQFPIAPGITDSDPLPDLLDQLNQKKIPTILVHTNHKKIPSEFLQGWFRAIHAIPSENQTKTGALLESIQEELANLAQKGKGFLCIELANLLPPWEIPDEFLKPYFGDASTEPEPPEPLLPGEEAQGPFPIGEPTFDPQPGFLDPDDDLVYLNLQETYGAAVACLDAILGEIMAIIKKLDLTSRAALVLVSDVGMSLGDHGMVGEIRPWLHEEMVHLPLLICLPGSSYQGIRLSALVQPVDLAPTLAGLMGVSFPPCEGFNLQPLWEGEIPKVRDYACSGSQVGNNLEWSIRTNDWALLVPAPTNAEDQQRSIQLYMKPEDRWEFNNVRHHQSEISEFLEKTLKAIVVAAQQSRPFQPPTIFSVDPSPTKSSPD